MDFEQEKISDEAIAFLKNKENTNKLCLQFTDVSKFPPEEKPVSVFMAGSPGAGKTEFSKSFIKQLGRTAVRIDADEVRKFLPHYKGNNSEVVQRASALGVEKIYDCALRNKQNLVLDGTFTDLKKSLNNIERSLNKNRTVSIFYIFQDPIIAWELTKAREEIEHRNVPKQVFLKSFFTSKENVNIAKQTFGNKVELNVVVKDYENMLDKFNLNVEIVDGFLPTWYNRDELERKLL